MSVNSATNLELQQQSVFSEHWRNCIILCEAMGYCEVNLLYPHSLKNVSISNQNEIINPWKLLCRKLVESNGVLSVLWIIPEKLWERKSNEEGKNKPRKLERLFEIAPYGSYTGNLNAAELKMCEISPCISRMDCEKMAQELCSWP